ncbi:MAG: tRNA uridine-5-carboxymethylaminomethyl(34) synthesis GTPase MnmE [Pseudomonadota bacterium]
MTDTIFALSSGQGVAGVAVVRLSGPKSADALQQLTQRAAPTPRRASLRTLRRADDGAQLDDALVLLFPAPASFTGEDVVELHLHGGRATVRAVLDALADLGLRAAEAGEFTRRAFQNGQLDLAQVEGLGDLLSAQTERQRLQALGQMTGALGRRAEAWRGRLTEALGLMAAAIDFPDEEDAPDIVSDAVAALLEDLERELETELAASTRGALVRDGYQVAILGPPNAGKSSLLNAFARRDVAIVSPEAGATRDVVEATLELSGCPVVIADTAGLRVVEAASAEAEGVRRAKARADAASLRLWVEETNGARAVEAPAPSAEDWRVINKVDEGDRGCGPTEDWTFAVSAKTGAGLSALLAAIKGRVADALGGEPPAMSRARHRQELGVALEALRRAGARLKVLGGAEPELAAEDIRLATLALSRLVGAVDVEDVLGHVFASFCIGK